MPEGTKDYLKKARGGAKWVARGFLDVPCRSDFKDPLGNWKTSMTLLVTGKPLGNWNDPLSNWKTTSKGG